MKNWEKVNNTRYVLKDHNGEVVAKVVKQIASGKWVWHIVVNTDIWASGRAKNKSEAMKEAESRL